MKDELKQKVYFADTDTYGVVWHGTYLRWMEIGRVEFCDKIGIDLVKLKSMDIAIPVTNINIKYKASAKLNENIIVETSLSKITPLSATFNQLIKNADTGIVYTKAEVDIVAVTNDGKLYRRLPNELKTILEGAL